MTLLLSVVVYPIARKIGDKWIDRIATKLDGGLVQLLKTAVADSALEQDVASFLEEHPDQGKQLEENIREVMASDNAAAALATVIVPEPGAKLRYYKGLMEWIAATVRSYGRDVVLRGFLHGEQFLSYFVMKEVSHPIEFAIIADAYVEAEPLGLAIYVEEVECPRDRQARFRAQNELIALSDRKKLRYEDYKKLEQVTEIHDGWVKYRSLRGVQEFLDLDEKDRAKFRIATHAPVTEMMASLRELIEWTTDDLRKLWEALEAGAGRP